MIAHPCTSIRTRACLMVGEPPADLYAALMPRLAAALKWIRAPTAQQQRRTKNRHPCVSNNAGARRPSTHHRWHGAGRHTRSGRAFRQSTAGTGATRTCDVPGRTLTKVGSVAPARRQDGRERIRRDEYDVPRAHGAPQLTARPRSNMSKKCSGALK